MVIESEKNKMSISAIRPAFQQRTVINNRKNDNQLQKLSAPQKQLMNPSFGVSSGTVAASIGLFLLALVPAGICLWNYLTGNS